MFLLRYVCNRYQSDPRLAHWVAVKNILKYLIRTKDMLLIYGGDEDLIVSSYTDASFVTDMDYYKSQSGYVFTLNCGAVCWKSSKQDTVADSTMEAEYIAASKASKEVIWINKFLEEVGAVPSAWNLMELYCDNSGVVARAKEPRSHQKSRHIESKHHIIRHHVGKLCKLDY
jgi:hypothetical protein